SEVSLVGTVSSPFELHDLRIGANRAGNLTYDADLALIKVYDVVLNTGRLNSLLAEVSVNDAPLAIDQLATGSINAPISFELQATDADNDPLTYTIVESPVSGVVSGTPPNLVYTPPADFVGSATVTFTASDGSLTSNTGTVTLVSAPQTAAELWNYYDPAIRTDALNVEWNTNWVDGDITMSQIRYDLGDLNGTQTNASPKIAAYYAYP
ncbi:Ig-like domain-containing protein, partial [Pontiellaceae bacterium B12227]|nr:Ig-like domain-containing protein [Pontiellaceae bacterium B12227]